MNSKKEELATTGRKKKIAAKSAAKNKKWLTKKHGIQYIVLFKNNFFFPFSAISIC
jgi:hypothetical protein